MNKKAKVKVQRLTLPGAPGRYQIELEITAQIIKNLLVALPTDEARLEALQGICKHCGKVTTEPCCCQRTIEYTHRDANGMKWRFVGSRVYH